MPTEVRSRKVSTPGRALTGVLALTLLLLFAGPATAATVNVLWTSFPSVGGTTINLDVGDTIEWNVLLGHDLSEMAGQALFDACDFTGSNLIAVGPLVTQTTFNTAGVHYFSCSVGAGFHCDLLNMRVTVVVSGPAVPVAWPPAVAAALALAGLVMSRRLGLMRPRQRA